MNAVLLTLSIVSIAAALGLAWYAWRLRSEERRRSEARVALLSRAIDAVDGRGGQHEGAPVGSLFAPEHSAAARGAPLIKIAVGAAMAVILLVAAATGGRRSGGDVDSAGASAAPVRAAAAPLELISMRHEREGDTLTVTGLVRNPRTGGKVTRVAAVVVAFNRAGAFVASGRAGLDFTALDPGDESPFVVTVPGAADVGRYRVSFRTESGGVPHVDRRGDQTRLAALEN